MKKTFKPKDFTNPFIAAKVPSKFDEIEAEEFIREINSLIFLKNHPNIVSFIGWTMYGEIPVLITELAETTLLKFVEGFSSETNNGNFLKPCLQILWQITNAMEYLAEKKMIHRDVACRNVLLKEKNIAKLSDFGLCCCSDENGIFKDSLNKKFPLKWLAIEALTESTFSEKSDVWAFGILCWEIFSYGSIPYSTMLNSEMIGFLQDGNRLSKPPDAPAYIYELMLHCWDKNAKIRPAFSDICKGIRIMLEVETLNYGYLSLEKPFDTFS
uniref:Protein kinase domain-containing protein n=1 Tax=Panagrolaimus sp. ES5 TaxID=591445 RepID=A0AC34F5U2_9BILA